MFAPPSGVRRREVNRCFEGFMDKKPFEIGICIGEEELFAIRFNGKIASIFTTLLPQLIKKRQEGKKR